MVLLCDLHEGDIVEIKDPVAETKLARVARITPAGELVIERKTIRAKMPWGVPHNLPIRDVVRIVERI